MEKQKTNYHHGNLCQSLIQAAGEMIQTQGPDALSMRKLADYVGVSRTAPYHHFKDKNELLCAVAEEGFARQDKIVNSQNHDTSTGLAELEALVQRYIQFAMTHPAHYDLMYGGKIWKQKLATDSLQTASRNSFRHWLSRIEDLQSRHIISDEETPLRVAQVAWATLHGLCRLANDGVYIDSDQIMAMGKSAAKMMLANH
ncbi:MAG: TetR/AcrR family transcriptional regulator [Leucothrix sp.]